MASASRLLRERGLEGTSVADVMSDAGMTHGGFYKHFDSKEALVERALDDAFSAFVRALERADSDQVRALYRTYYLSRGHMAQPGMGCPVAALGAEVARGSNALKAAFGAGIRRVVGALAGHRKGQRRRTADCGTARVQHAGGCDGDRAG